MRRTYPRGSALLGAALLVSGLSIPLIQPLGSSARALFDSKPLQQKRFAVLAQPVGASDWKLLVLEQIKPRPLCWTPRPDGLMEPTLNSFNFSGICSRYLDSNGYSLRTGDRDLSSRFRLRLVQNDNTLQLQVIDPTQAAPILVGRAPIPGRDRNGFVRIKLDRGWTLERRVYQGRTLSHVYFAHPEPVNSLLAKAGRSGETGFSRLGAPRAPVKPAPMAARIASQRNRTPDRRGGNGPIRLDVIPYRP